MRLHEVEQTSDRTILEPSLCGECGGRSFRLLQEESHYIDTQTARMQEPLENLSGGTEPKQMLMILEDDLVDELNPGDKVRITGTLKTFREERSGKFKNYIYVNHIEPLEQEFEELHLSEEDEEEILELSKDPNIYEKIIKSTAPSIRGYRDVKESIALQLFGGSAKQLEDETRLRGDIHILIVGDPGIGKSQILKYVSKLAPRSIYTSGKGTTGAGLTAAAVRDELGGWSLEAGALVLAIRCKQFGLVNFLIALILGGMCAYWTLVMMIKAGRTTKERDYSKVVKATLGNKVGIFMDCNIALYLFGAIISFQVIILVFRALQFILISIHFL